jgi:hypothetical protein
VVDRSTLVRVWHRVFSLFHANGKRVVAFKCITMVFVADAFPSISCIAKSRARCRLGRLGRVASAVAWEPACSRSVRARAG